MNSDRPIPRTRRFRLIKIFIVPLLCFGLAVAATAAAGPRQARENASPQEQYYRALRLVGQDQEAEAVPLLQALIHSDPAYYRSYLSLAEIYISMDRIAEGRQFFQQLLQAQPKNAYAIYGLAQFAIKEGEKQTAIDNLKLCIKLAPAFSEAYDRNGGLPAAYAAAGNIDGAIGYFEDMVALDPQNAFAYLGLANSYIRKLQLERAIEVLNQALALDPALTWAYRSLLYCNIRLSRHAQVFEVGKKLQALASRENDIEMMSYAALITGNSYIFLGDYGKALQHLSTALRLATEVGAKGREGNVLMNMATINAMSGNFHKALEYFETVLGKARNRGDTVLELQLLNNIGNIYKDIREYAKSEAYYQQALALARRNGIRAEESLILSNLGELYQRSHDLEKANASLHESLKIARALKDKAQEGYVLRSLGSLQQEEGRYSEALGTLQQALALGRYLGDAQIMWESEAGLGATFEKTEQNALAIQHYDRAIAIYDSVRTNLGVESLRTGFFEDKYETYPAIVALLASRGQYEEAFAHAEKYKAKFLLEILSQGKYALGGLLPDSVRQGFKAIEAQIESIHDKISQARSAARQDMAELVTLDQQLTDAELRKSALLEHTRNTYPEFYQLTTAEPLHIRDIQADLLGPDQTLVEYLVGPEKLSVFILTSDTLIYRSVALGRTKIGSMLTDFSPIFKKASESAGHPSTAIFNARLADFSVPPAFALYQALIQPIEPWLDEGKELIIVPDDNLFYLPFESLVVDTSNAASRYDFDHAHFLLEKYAISYSASASLLDPRLQRTRTATKGVLAVGNPQFAPAEKEQFFASKSPLAVDLPAGEALPSLPYAEKEVKAINAALGGLENQMLIGEQATESAFKKSAAAFRILHLAVHFLMNDQQPLYSKIVLSPDASAGDDGILQTYEVFNMRLNADLAVLSACNSGLGKLSKGEGIVGISRAFLYAGIPSLVVSLWSVDDEATSLLMKEFYKFLKAGYDKRQALRKAKLKYLGMTSGAKRDPFYWAPFVLLGDWRPVPFPQSRGFSSTTIFAGAILVLLLIGVAARSMHHRRMRRRA